MRVLINIDTSTNTYLTHNITTENKTVIVYINNVYNFAHNINIKIIAYKSNFTYFGLNFEDFANMKDGEIREVFINLED